MNTAVQLEQQLMSIHRKSYPAYKSLAGSWQFSGFILHIDHVQGDPFAAPSKVSVEVSQKTAAFPEELFDRRDKRIALQDHLTREFSRQVGEYMFQAKGSGKSGLISISRCGQEVLERTALEMNGKRILVRFEVGFPANGRTINAPELKKILFDYVPQCVKRALYYKNLNPKVLREVADLAEDQTFIREELKKRNLAAFVANGAVLPRQSGVSDKPMKGAVVFESPRSMEVELSLPHKGALKGMAVPRGITLIVGGGYHGKSTLLKALELGVYNHIKGDGREYVITDDTAMKIRAEDGRAVAHVDISPFINHLPNGKDTVDFSTEDASGSTSQAANVVEAVEAGGRRAPHRRGHLRHQLHGAGRPHAVCHRQGAGAYHPLYRAGQEALRGEGRLGHPGGGQLGSLLLHRGQDHPDGHLPGLRYHGPCEGYLQPEQGGDGVCGSPPEGIRGDCRMGGHVPAPAPWED